MLQQAFGNGLRCGAPPDDFHPHGQDWGVVPFHPLALRRDYSTSSNNTRKHAPCRRPAHRSHYRLAAPFIVPLGEQPGHGCYLNFPREELFAILALESQRNSCMVMGEDLGTLPDGFRDHMREQAMFGCAVLYFERLSDGRFPVPRDYPAQSIASVATHDLPTLVGYWEDAI